MGKALNSEHSYSLDTFPVAVCDNYRIPRAKISLEETYRGYVASKRRYFYGLKIHRMVAKQDNLLSSF